MNSAELERRAIEESVQIAPYDQEWPAQFRLERDRLIEIVPSGTIIEHIGSTAVPGLAAKPIIDIMAAVTSMESADEIVTRLCDRGYLTSSEFNRSLGDRRWLMRQAGGRRTHHLHLVLSGSPHWMQCIRFRDALRADSDLAIRYAELKERLADQFGGDRDGYGNAKTAFITATLATTQ